MPNYIFEIRYQPGVAETRWKPATYIADIRKFDTGAVVATATGRTREDCDEDAREIVAQLEREDRGEYFESTLPRE